MSNFTVHTGLWTDHSRSGLSATSFTLTVSSASLLVSALATFVTLIGGRFWSIVAYAIHQIRASDSAADGLHHQHQAVYRNASSHLTAVWYILRIGWAWRGRVSGIWWRTTVSLLPPLLTFVGFAIASIFSGKVTNPAYAASKVLVDPHTCGFLAWNNDFLKDNGSTIMTQWGAKVSMQALDYARACYEENDVSTMACDVFPVPNLPYDTQANVSCPFMDGRCYLGPNSAYQLSTPWLNSYSDFGLNDSPEDRVEFRREMTCSLIDVGGLVENVTTLSGSLFYEYYLGTLEPLSTATFVAGNMFEIGAVLGYTLQTQTFWFNRSTNIWKPSTEVFNTSNDADIDLFFLNANWIQYETPVNDPMFSAHRPFEEELITFGSDSQTMNVTVYLADYNGVLIGCNEQFQLRNPNGEQTSELASLSTTNTTFQALGLTARQQVTAHRLIESVAFYQLSQIPGDLGAQALKAQMYVDDGAYLSKGLPDNQWQEELKGWFDMGLALHQQTIVSFVSKDISAFEQAFDLYSINALIPSISESEAEGFCHNQIVRNTGGYQSFSMLGLVLVIIFGFSITLLSCCIEPLVNSLRRRLMSNNGRFKSELWRTDFMLQQQRMAFEAEGLGVWTQTRDTVPITQKGESFSVRNLTENVSYPPSLRSSTVVEGPSTRYSKSVRYSEVPIYGASPATYSSVSSGHLSGPPQYSFVNTGYQTQPTLYQYGPALYQSPTTYHSGHADYPTWYSQQQGQGPS